MNVLEVTKRQQALRQPGRRVRRVDAPSQTGELRAIIGPNGAGKTTFFNLISGYLRPTAGNDRFDGQNITACRRTNGSSSAWAAPSRSPRFFRNSPCSKTCGSPPRWPAAIVCGLAQPAGRKTRFAAKSRRRWNSTGLASKADRLVGRARAWRPARRRDRHGARVAAAPAAARRAHRRHGRPGDLRDHATDPPTAPRQQFHASC